MISFIVAHDKNRVIGYQNGMPWHLPGELKYFKEMTMGKPVVMGRKTFESIGRPLPGRRNIVITRNADYHVEGIEVVSSLEKALELAKEAPEIMIIGGAQIFEQAMPLADKLYVTIIDHEFPGDTYFPNYEGWKKTAEQPPIVTPEGYRYQYCIFEK